MPAIRMYHDSLPPVSRLTKRYISVFFMRSFVADGNFKANHLKQKSDSTDIWLTNGEGFMTENDRYNAHLNAAIDSAQVMSFPPAQHSCQLTSNLIETNLSSS